MRALNITGRRFGRLIVLEETVSRRAASGKWIRQFRVRCDCGKHRVVQWSNLRYGKTQSCGCIRREQIATRSYKHGDATRGFLTTEYTTYCGMLQRCYNKNLAQFNDYGGRGISVCPRWKNGEGGKSGYQCFLTDMGRRPTPLHTLDRYPNNNGNYEPTNCRWATRSQQRLNRRGVIKVRIGDEDLHLGEACKRFGVHYKTARSRLKAGWSIARTFELDT